MTKPRESIRELLDESLVEQLTRELEAPPKQGVLLHRIALAAACLLLVAGIAGVGLWASRQSPAILGPTSAVSEEASSLRRLAADARRHAAPHPGRAA